MQEPIIEKRDVMTDSEMSLMEFELDPKAINILVETLDLFFRGEAA